MTRFETTTCYHCDAEGTGREHVPPRCLFPKGRDWSRLITVPSCVIHNNANSKADEYLKLLLGASTSNIPADIVRSTARSVIRLAHKRSANLRRYGFRWDSDTLVIENDFPLDFELLRACLAKIARAIYFYHHCGRQKLHGDLEVWPLFIPLDPSVPPELASAVSQIQAWTSLDFEQLPRLGSHKEIFAYQVIESAEIVVINMEFYGAHQASVMGARL